MAAPPTQASSPLVAGLLQSLAPWMTGANPSALDNSFQQYGGTTGLLSAMLQDAPGSQGAANFGKALQGVQSDALQTSAARQQLASQNIGLQQNLAMFPYFMTALEQYGGGAAPSQAQSASAPSMVTPSADSTDEQPQAATSASGATPATAQPSAAPAASPAPQSGTNLASGLNLARIMALTNRPGADTFLRSLTADPAYITQSKLAGDPLVVDQAEMAEAARAQDPQAYLSAYTKYLTDANRLHISSMSGNVTGFGLPPWVLQSMANYNPQSGKMTVNGRQELIPGAAETEAALEAARSGAEESAKLRAGLQPLTGANYGAGSSVPVSASAPTTSRAPAAQPAGQAAIDSPDYIPPLLSGPAKAAPRPGNIGIAALGKFQEGQAEEAQKVQGELTEQAENSQMLLTQAQQIEAAARNFTPGKYADVKGEILSVLQPTGLLSDKQVKELGSYQEGQKLSIQLQALATKQLGSREAAQVFSVLGKSIPNLTLSPD